MTETNTDAHRDLLAAIADALDVPLAHYTDIADEQTLRSRRAEAVRTAVRFALDATDPARLTFEAETLRRRTGQLPVTYRRHIATAPDHPDDCVVCGPDCCAPVLAIHSDYGRPAGGNFRLPLTQLQVAPSATSEETANVG